MRLANGRHRAGWLRERFGDLRRSAMCMVKTVRAARPLSG